MSNFIEVHDGKGFIHKVRKDQILGCYVGISKDRYKLDQIIIHLTKDLDDIYIKNEIYYHEILEEQMDRWPEGNKSLFDFLGISKTIIDCETFYKDGEFCWSCMKDTKKYLGSYDSLHFMCQECYADKERRDAWLHQVKIWKDRSDRERRK